MAKDDDGTGCLVMVVLAICLFTTCDKADRLERQVDKLEKKVERLENEKPTKSEPASTSGGSSERPNDWINQP